MLLGRKSVNKLNKLTFGFCFSHPPPPLLSPRSVSLYSKKSIIQNLCIKCVKTKKKTFGSYARNCFWSPKRHWGATKAISLNFVV